VPILIIMGAAGAGKTTVAQQLADELGWSFYDADALHPAENVARMRGGMPLRDQDRSPWLQAVGTLIASAVELNESAVIACSALRARFRQRLHDAADGTGIRFVYLRATPQLLASRLAGRRDHFFPQSLLASQLSELEEPSLDERSAPALTVDADQPVASIVEQIRAELHL
jgi:gluconokinase